MSAQSVLDVLNRAAELHGKIHGNTDAVEAVALVSELIAADKEYDEAMAAEDEAEADGDDDLIINAGKRVQWAKDRRASALAALEQQS